MSYLLVEDFKYGMDRRRKRVAGTSGTLWIGENVHITRGGDVERRKKFVAEYAVPGTFGAAALRSQIYVFGSADLAASMPVGVQYQRLPSLSGEPMSGILAVKSVSGKLYVIAEYEDGNVYHFYNGARVTDWDVVAAAGASLVSVAQVLANKLDANPAVTAAAFGSTVTVTAKAPGVPFTISAVAVDGGGIVDQSAAVTAVAVNVAPVAETLATVDVTITGGSEDPANSLQAIYINNVNVVPDGVLWSGSNSATAIRLGSAITFNAATFGYNAVANGNVVTIYAAAGTGATPNGFEVGLATRGTFTAIAGAFMAGGVTAVVAQRQVAKVTFGGTFQPQDTFSVTVNGALYKTTGRASGTGRSLYIDKQRVWSPVQSLWRYSMLNRPDVWDSANPVSDNDAGFINIASETEGNEDLQVAARYQGFAGIFSASNIVLFQLDTDPANFAFSDLLENTGTRSVDSVQRYGNNDVFYLDITGIRSLRARDASNAPFVSDIGNAIDPFVAEQLALLTGEEVLRAVAAIEPIDGRYLLFVGNLAFVLSYFPGAKISAWTYYALEEFGGNSVQAVLRIRNRMIVRAGAYLFVYGGITGDAYPGNDEVIGKVETPFLSGKTPATIKQLTGFDSAATNTWEVEVAFDPNDDRQTINVGRLNKISFADPNKIAMPGETSMVALKMTCRTAGDASLSMMAVHYEGESAPG